MIKDNNELPSLTPDRDQVEAFKNTRSFTEAKTSKNVDSGQNNEPSNVKLQRSEWRVFTTLLIFSLGGFGGWWFYQQDLHTQSILDASEGRIQELERQLSATGEEMGESSGAIKARLSTLTIKSEELWSEMDKLWASAWRRNQADIAALEKTIKSQVDNISEQGKQNQAALASLKTINQKLTDTDFNIGILSEQVQAAEKLKSKIDELNNSLATLQASALSRDKKQIDLAIINSQLKNEQQLLLDRIKRLESRLAITNP